MTIAQYKIRRYCKDNNISLHKLSAEMGYSVSYLSNIARGKIPSCIERGTLNEFFDIADESKMIPIRLKNKYRFATVAATMYRLDYGITVSYDCMVNYFRGRRPRDRRRLNALCKMCNLKNEWTEKHVFG